MPDETDVMQFKNIPRNAILFFSFLGNQTALFMFEDCSN